MTGLIDDWLNDVVAVARLDDFRTRKSSNLDDFRALNASNLDLFRLLIA